MTPGRLLYLVWYKPAALLARSWRAGGPISQLITRRGRLEMVTAAGRSFARVWHDSFVDVFAMRRTP
jgi:hypothetical protein